MHTKSFFVKLAVIMFAVLFMCDYVFAAPKLIKGNLAIEDTTISLDQLASDVTNAFLTTSEAEIIFGEQWDLKSLDDLADGSTYGRATLTQLGYIDQDVTSGSQPLFGTIEVGSAATYLSEDVSGNLTFNDTVSGSNTLAELKAGLSPFEDSSDVIREKDTDYDKDFVFGSPGLDYSTQAARFFFDKGKSAFRAGYCDTTNWDNAQLGAYSTAFGYDALATGMMSFAVASGAQATNTGAISMGYNTIASGENSVAIGGEAVASAMDSMAIGQKITSNANHTIAFGLDDTARTAETANTMVIMGGKVGIGDLAPDYDLSVAGTVEATAYIGDGSSLTGLPASVFEIASDVIREKSAEGYDNNFVFGSPQLADDEDTAHDKRFFFDKAKGAFRAGYVSVAQWDDVNVGESSTAFGIDTTASGAYSFAGGLANIASGTASTAFGSNTTASGSYATSLGSYTSAKSNNSTALGTSVIVGTDATDAQYSIGIGLDDTVRTIETPNVMAIMGGKVGIGDLAPDYELSVAGTVEALYFTGDGSSLTNIAAAASDVSITDSGDYFSSDDVEGALQELGPLTNLIQLSDITRTIEVQTVGAAQTEITLAHTPYWEPVVYHDGTVVQTPSINYTRVGAVITLTEALGYEVDYTIVYEYDNRP